MGPLQRSRRSEEIPSRGGLVPFVFVRTPPRRCCLPNPRSVLLEPLTNPSEKRLPACFFLRIATPLPCGAIALSKRTVQILVGSRGLTVYSIVAVTFFGCYPLRSRSNRRAPGGAWRLEVIFARVAKYAPVTICCQALRTQHVAFLF